MTANPPVISHINIPKFYILEFGESLPRVCKSKHQGHCVTSKMELFKLLYWRLLVEASGLKQKVWTLD